MVAAAVELTVPLLAKAAIDAATTGRTVVTIAGALVVLACLRWAAQFGRRYLAGRLSLDVQHTLRLDLLTTLQRLDGPAQDQMRTGQVVSRSISDLQVVQGTLAMVPLSLGALIQFVLAIVVMIWLSPLLTLVALTVVPIAAAIVWFVRPSVHASTWSAQQQAAEIAQHVDETVTGIRVVKGFGRSDWAVSRLESLARNLYSKRMRSARINARFSPAMSAVPALGLVGVVALGGVLAMHGSISIGTFVAFTAYVGTMSASARILSSVVVMAQMTRSAAERIYGILAITPDITAPAAPRDVPIGPLGLRFDDVSFGDVLHAIDLDIAPGETVAVVGRAGSGKTLLAMLADRFYAPDSGHIELVGDTKVDIRDVRLDDLRGAVTVAFDEPFIASTTVSANIGLGTDATPADIESAARAAAALDFITELPDGFDTVIGERGLTVSGGQRQRIALARAILADAPILVLDDATSAVDAETEASIFANLRHLQKTVLVLAHRRSTLSIADRVAVLDDGRIVDIGTVDELDERCALFRNLMDADPEADALPALAAAPARRERRGKASALAGQDISAELQSRLEKLPPATEEPPPITLDPSTNHRFSLRQLLHPVRWLLIAAVVGITIDTASGTALPALIGRAVDRGVLAHESGPLWTAVAIATGLVLLAWCASVVTTILTARAGERVLYALRLRSFAHLQRLGLDYFERELSGRIMTRMTTDVDALSTFLQNGVAVAVVSLLTLVAVSIALLITDAGLALVAFIAIPILVGATVVFRRISSRAYTRSRERVSTVNAAFHEAIDGLRTAQAYRASNHILEDFTAKAEAYRAARMQAQKAISTYFPFVAFLSDIALAAVLWEGAKDVSEGTLTPGTLIAFVLYLGMLFGPVQQLSQVFDGYQQARVGLRRIRDLLHTEVTQTSGTGTPPKAGDIHADDVTFGYSGAAEFAVSNISLTIRSGESLALVGRTGAGKSTIVKLIARFYDPSDGHIRFDGHDISSLDLGDYQRVLGLVPQEAHLFTGDVASNIAFGRPEATRAEIHAAAEAVGARAMIEALPDGFDHSVGERGRGLSAGQRQLIALARAELVDPSIVLLDEATAALDPATERIVLDASRALTRSRTTVIVAHRLSTAARADRIAVIEHGRVVEIGTHAGLVAAGGAYSRFWEASQRSLAHNSESPARESGNRSSLTNGEGLIVCEKGELRP
ncbi:ABC transporter ATP-binding protein [Smaragdicoccus niigatensis]